MNYFLLLELIPPSRLSSYLHHIQHQHSLEEISKNLWVVAWAALGRLRVVGGVEGGEVTNKLSYFANFTFLRRRRRRNLFSSFCRRRIFALARCFCESCVPPRVVRSSSPMCRLDVRLDYSRIWASSWLSLSDVYIRWYLILWLSTRDALARASKMPKTDSEKIEFPK